MIDHRLVRGFKQLSVILGLIIGIVGGVGSLIYVLYRVAMFNRSVYAIIFYIALCGLIVFYTFRGIQKKLLTSVLLKVARVLVKISVILCIVSAVMLYGALVVRYPVGGGIATAFLITLIIIAGLRFRFFTFFRKIF